MTEEKQYGLIIPGAKKQKKTLGIRALNPLKDSDDELENDSTEPLNWVEASLKKSAGNAGQKSLQKRMLREALEEDASVFQYDEIYDDMQTEKNKIEQAKKNPVVKKPKYIENILKAAEKRKIEQERRTERNVQKEREAEGDMFADKEAFVTESYRKKLDELKIAAQEEELERRREEATDVHKHKNFNVFYNHLFKQKMGEVEIKQEPPEEDGSTFKNVDVQKKKNYRRHRENSESPEREDRPIKRERITPESSDASDTETNRSQSTSNHNRRHKNVSGDSRRNRSRSRSKEKRSRKDKSSDSSSSSSEEEDSKNDDKKVKLTKEEQELMDKQKKLEMITKLFSKRTVGDKYDEAVKKYFERKSKRECSG